MGLLDFFGIGSRQQQGQGLLGQLSEDQLARERRRKAAYEANTQGNLDPKVQARFGAEQRLGGLSEALLGLPDMLNTAINAGITDVDYFTGGGLSGGTYDPYQLPMASEAANRFAAESREMISGTKPVDPKTMPKDVQKQAARERKLFGMIPTGAEDVAGLAVPAMKAMFLGLKKSGTPEEAANALDALNRLARGEDPKTVWAQSKWAVDPIGKYPYTEISDQPMAFKPDVAAKLAKGQRVQGSLRDLIDHPELFAAYPGLGGIKADLGTGKFGGEWDGNTLWIKGSAPGVLRGTGPADKPHLNLEQLMAHEIQHIIQQAEGWPRGSNLTAGSVITPEIADSMQVIKDAEKRRKELYRIYTRKSGQESRDAYAQWQHLGRVMNQAEDEIRVAKGFEYYRRQPGEVQARNTGEGRFGLTEEERLAKHPEETMDVPISEQAKTYGTGFGKPKAPVLSAIEEENSGGLMGIAQAYDPGDLPPKPKKLTKPEREAAELQSLSDEARGLFNMEATPNVPQTQIPRYTPPKGVPQRILDLTSNPEVRRMMLEKIAEGRKVGADKWYNMEPLRLAFVDEFGEAQGTQNFNKYLDYVAGTSPKSTVPENWRNASYYYGLDVKGQPLPEPYTTPEGKVIKNPPPYGHFAQDLHRMNAEKIRSGQGLDFKSNPKPLGFVEDLKGNLRPVAVDAHAYRLPAMLAQDPRFLETSLKAEKGVEPRNIAREFAENRVTMEEALANPTYWQGKPKDNEYQAMEQYYQSLADEVGLPPGETQASAWVGGGPLTGLKSDETKTGMELFIERLAYTAQQRKEPIRKVLKDMMRGDNPLLTLAGFGLLPMLYQMQGDRQGGVINELREKQ